MGAPKEKREKKTQCLQPRTGSRPGHSHEDSLCRRGAGQGAAGPPDPQRSRGPLQHPRTVRPLPSRALPLFFFCTRAPSYTFHALPPPKQRLAGLRRPLTRSTASKTCWGRAIARKRCPLGSRPCRWYLRKRLIYYTSQLKAIDCKQRGATFTACQLCRGAGGESWRKSGPHCGSRAGMSAARPSPRRAA